MVSNWTDCSKNDINPRSFRKTCKASLEICKTGRTVVPFPLSGWEDVEVFLFSSWNWMISVELWFLFWEYDNSLIISRFNRSSQCEQAVMSHLKHKKQFLPSLSNFTLCQVQVFTVHKNVFKFWFGQSLKGCRQLRHLILLDFGYFSRRWMFFTLHWDLWNSMSLFGTPSLQSLQFSNSLKGKSLLKTSQY